jgi:putative methyltransferase (TIGR04325 family)
MLKRAIESLCPPAITAALRRASNRLKPMIVGDFATYDQAIAALPSAQAYEQDYIIQKTIDDTHRVQRESQDQSLAYTPALQRLLASLAGPIATRNRPDVLRVVDFGGQMGTHFFYARAVLPASLQLQWTVCETPATAAAARKHVNVPGLSFTDDLDSLSREPVDLVFTSGTLMHLPSPTEWLKKLLALRTHWCVIERTAMTDWSRDRLGVQMRSSPRGREAAYPFWLVRHAQYLAAAKEAGFAPALQWALDDHAMLVDGQVAHFRGVQLHRASA